jgi:hypothetical protein
MANNRVEFARVARGSRGALGWTQMKTWAVRAAAALAL